MTLLDTLEHKFGRFAIPHLIRTLAIFQAMVWLLVKLQPGFLETIVLTREGVLAGQVWRLVSWVTYPGNLSILFILISTMFMFMMGDALEQAWGAFRVNLYILVGMVAAILQVLLLPVGGVLVDENGAAIWGGGMYAVWLNASILFAFAAVAPNFEILMFFILPMKMKWVGLISAGLVVLAFVDTPPVRLPILASLVNFVLAFVPAYFKGMKQKAVVMERRARFESAKQTDASYFHKCSQCGKTDVSDPKLDFRVTSDDEEYCVDCLAKKG